MCATILLNLAKAN